MDTTPAGDSGDDDSRPVVYDLDPTATVDALERETPYLATINGIVDYGIFVDVSDEVSGLVHESTLEGTFAVGDEIAVELDQIRENGDIAFTPADVELSAAEVETLDRDVTLTGSNALEAGSDDRIHLEGEVVQIKQTAGPTVFHVADEEGIVPCAAFESAGVRAYPDIAVGDLVRVSGTAEDHRDSVQVEVTQIEPLEGEGAEAARERLDAALTERAEPESVEPLIEWDAMAPLRDDLRAVARRLRRAVLTGRPIRIRHHADGDGMCAAVPVQLALERYVESVHADPEAPSHLVRRLPSKAPYYEMEDATRDLNHALEDRERHGHQLPLLVMLDNGSTAEDVPAYRTLTHYDIPIVTVDHHHPDPEAVDGLLAEHVNPYHHGEDYRITAGMLCVELARMIDPALSDDLRHVPAIAGISDRSKADALDRYLELAADAGYDASRLADVSEALDFAAYYLRYSAGNRLIRDILGIANASIDRHRELVTFLADRSRTAVDRQLSAADPHVEDEELANDATLYRLDVENHAYRFTYPAPGKTTGELHDRKIAETSGPVITIGVGPDFVVLRSDGVRLDIPEMVSELQAEHPGAGVSGGGHLVVGSIRFVKGKRETVIDALVEKMAEAAIDDALSAATPIEKP